MSRSVLFASPSAGQIEDIRYELTIRAAPSAVFEALTNSRIIDEWGGGPARVQAKSNGRYSLWDGEMSGTIKEIEYPRRLVLALREASWDPAYLDSLVTIGLEEAPRGTLLSLVHSGLPTRRIREIHNDGWGEYFLGPLKVHME